jgi:hypothetical protein
MNNLPLNPFDDPSQMQRDFHAEAESSEEDFQSKTLSGRKLFRWEILFFVFRFFKKVLFEGGETLITKFEYRNETHIFETQIQVDADTVNFIPDIEKYRRDEEWRELYEKKIAEHFERLDEFFVKIFASVRLWGIILFIPIMLLFNQDFFEELFEMLSDEDGDGQIWDLNDFGNNYKDLEDKNHDGHADELNLFEHPYLEPYIGQYECTYNKYDFYVQFGMVLFSVFVRPWVMGVLGKIGGWFLGKIFPYFYNIFMWFYKRRKARKKK